MLLEQEILSDVVIFNKYAKFIPEINRRETWEELCQRNMSMHIQKYPEMRAGIQKAYKNFVMPKKVMPSMRSLQFAGEPIELSNNRMFNCAFLPIDHSDGFSETMFLLLGGSGVGYSVQNRDIGKLPTVLGPKPRPRRFLIGDSIEGWADSIKILVESYFYGKSDPNFDFRDIRKKGARLVTSGGKAPGPAPLKICLDEIRNILDSAIGRNLTSVEVHDIMCFIADAVLSGGIRRAAMISLFDKTDHAMLTCKGQVKVDNWELEPKTVKDDTSYHGFCIYKGTRHDVVLSKKDYKSLTDTQCLPWFFFEQQRGRANNSIVLHREETTEEEFNNIWKLVQASGAGEPGVFWTNDYTLGTNPCCEISLKAFQFCNLTEVNVSDVEDQDELNSRVQAGAFIGTLQAGYTNFHYLRDIWRETTEEEALIGVGMTGIGSGKILDLDLTLAAELVKQVNEVTAGLIGINVAARTTTIKPSGTTSLALGTASGIHAWHALWYIRRMRIGKNESLYTYILANFPELVEDDFFKPHIEAVMSFPQKAPEGSIIRTESFLDLLERVKKFNLEWVRKGHRSGENFHNVSCTISLKGGDWVKSGKWMWENRFNYTGISVLPYDGGTYTQAPFEDCTEEQYTEMCKHLHKIDLSKVIELDDNTNLSDQAACAGNGCEVNL